MRSQHTREVKDRIDGLVEHLRASISDVEDPRAEALYETSAEVLQGIRTAFDHYERRSEEAWREDGR